MKILSNLRSSLSKKLLIVLLIAFVLPSGILLKWLYDASKEIAYQESQEYLSSNLKSTANGFDEILRNVDFIHMQVAADKEFLRTNANLLPLNERRSYSEHEVQSAILKSLNQYYISNNYMSSLYLYNAYGDVLYVYSMDYTKNNIISRASTLKENSQYKYMFDEFKTWRIVNQYGTNQKQFTSVTKPNVFSSNEKPLYLSVNVDFTLLENRLTSSFSNRDIGIYVVDSQKNKMTIAKRPEDKQVNNIMKQKQYQNKEGYEICKIKGVEYMASYYNTDYSKLTYVAYAPVLSISSTTKIIQKFEKYYIIAILFILLILLLFIAVNILKPIQKLYQALQTVANEDLTVRLPEIRSKDEISYIYKAFNHMTENIERLIHENYENKIVKQEFELKYIQTQINEHFLYNTIDCVHWIANKHKIPEISKIMFSLSKYFRLTLNQGQELVTPIQINDLFTQYIYLLNMRKNNEIQYSCTIDPRLTKVKLLKYIFQPIFENAVIHGLQQGRKGSYVEISFTIPCENTIRFQVKDDGVGIEPERLEEIRKQISGVEKPTVENPIADKKHFFALSNVNQQINLYYGTTNSIIIQSEVEKETRVYFDIILKGGIKDV